MCYTDNFIDTWHNGRTQLNTFLEHLISLCQKVQLTKEIKRKTSCPFQLYWTRANGYPCRMIEGILKEHRSCT